MMHVLSSLFLVIALAQGQGCPKSEDTDELYNYWFSVSAEVRKEGGETKYYTRYPPAAEAKEAWECLETAGSLGNCKALHVLELYNRYGMGKDSFGIEANPEKADAYRKKMQEQCSE